LTNLATTTLPLITSSKLHSCQNGSAMLAAIVAGAGWTSLAIGYLVAYFVLRISMAWVAGVWGLRDQTIISKLWLFRCATRSLLSCGWWDCCPTESAGEDRSSG
jgi:hypothetical protein